MLRSYLLRSQKSLKFTIGFHIQILIFMVETPAWQAKHAGHPISLIVELQLKYSILYRHKSQLKLEQT